jgi:hypothetical protein
MDWNFAKHLFTDARDVSPCIVQSSGRKQIMNADGNVWTTRGRVCGLLQFCHRVDEQRVE